MRRIEKKELDRRMLARNDREVFESCIEGLKKESIKKDESEDPFLELKRKQEELKKKKNKNIQ
jgi:hypothetical protein